MNKEKSALIIGAGMGGISTAIILSRNGYKVDIYEKNLFPGGRCGQILREGHRFDIGATILMMPSVYRNVFNSLGLNFDECFNLKRLEEVYKLYFEDGKVLTFSTDKEVMKAQLEQIEPGSYNNYCKYISTGYAFFTLAMKDLLGRNFTHLLEFISFRNVILLFKLKAYVKHKNYIRRFFKNNHLRHSFIFQNIYVGQSPLDSPALFSMLPAAELTEGALFPMGGMYSITEKLITTAEGLGCKFHFGLTAAQIQVNGGLAEGVVFQDGSKATANLIIANADLPYVYRELLGDQHYKKKLEKKKYACSAIVFHWGLKKAYPLLGHHSVFLSDDSKGSMDMIFKHHSLSVNPSFYIHSPVRTDNTAAPEGEDSLSVIIPIGRLSPKSNQDWSSLIKSARNAVIRRLVNSGLKDIEENIKFEICYPPATWENIFNVSKGSVFGSLKHSIMQMGYFRPHNRHRRFRNLYFVGGSTHPGNGVPLVLMSAKLTAERILMEN